MTWPGSRTQVVRRIIRTQAEGEGFRGRHSARCPRSRARLLLDCSDSAQEYGRPEGEKVRAEVRSEGTGGWSAGGDEEHRLCRDPDHILILIVQGYKISMHKLTRLDTSLRSYQRNDTMLSLIH